MTDPVTERVRIAIVCEGPRDADVVRRLGDRITRERGAEWLREMALDDLRRWTGLERARDYSPWTAVKKLAETAGLRVLGHAVDGPGEPDFLVARKAIRVAMLKTGSDRIALLILLRDRDKQPRRLKGLRQAVASECGGDAMEVILGFACAKIEAWILHGFVPGDPVEEGLVAAERKRLGFDPCVRSHELDAKSHGKPARRDAKRVLGVLSQGCRDREDACVESSRLELLEERGDDSGLKAFLRDLETRLVPLVMKGRREGFTE